MQSLCVEIMCCRCVCMSLMIDTVRVNSRGLAARLCTLPRCHDQVMSSRLRTLTGGMQYIINNGGIDTEEDYPYVAQDAKCATKKEGRWARQHAVDDLGHKVYVDRRYAHVTAWFLKFKVVESNLWLPCYWAAAASSSVRHFEPLQRSAAAGRTQLGG